MSRSNPLLAWGLLLLLALIWGSSFILIKIGLKGLSAGEVGALRIFSASVFLVPMALGNLRGLTVRHWLLLIIVGIAGSLAPAFLFAAAQTSISSSVAGILNALTPMFTLIIGGLFFGQKMSPRTVFGLFLGLIGTVYLILSGSATGISNINFYALLVVLATIFYGINLNLIKYRITDLPARVITSISLLVAGPVSAAYLVFFTGFTAKLNMENAGPIGAILVLGIVGTALALILFNELVKLTNPVFTSSVTYIIPVIAVIWGVLDGEQLYYYHFIGMIMIITGVFLANKKRVAVKQPVSGG